MLPGGERSQGRTPLVLLPTCVVPCLYAIRARQAAQALLPLFPSARETGDHQIVTKTVLAL